MVALSGDCEGDWPRWTSVWVRERTVCLGVDQRGWYFLSGVGVTIAHGVPPSSTGRASLDLSGHRHSGVLAHSQGIVLWIVAKTFC